MRQPGLMAAILIVDDDPLQASLTMSHLRQRFGDVHRATDAAQAFCMIEQHDFAHQLGLVISAHNTLGIGGPAFVAELHDRMPALPVLVLGAPEDAHNDYADLYVAFLPRPIVAEEMLALTDRLLSQGKNVAA